MQIKSVKGLISVLKPFSFFRIKPDDSIPFSISNDDTRIYVYIDTSDNFFKNGRLDIWTSKTHRQVVLRVREPKRKLTVKGYLNLGDISIADTNRERDRLVQTILHEERVYNSSGDLPWRLSLDTAFLSRLQIVDIEVPGENIYESHTGYKQLVVRVTVQVIEKSDTTILAGKDESNTFISVLKKPVDSVAKAHRELLPPELKKLTKHQLAKVKRQGEYFFVPVSDKEAQDALKSNEDDMLRGRVELEKEDADGNCVFSGHMLTGLLICDTEEGRGRKVEYAFGEVNAPRHKSLFLPTLHKVLLNNETVLPDWAEAID